MKDIIIKKILNKEIKLGIVGLGYVGLPLALEGAKSGYRTLGFDVQSKKVEMVNMGKNYIKDIVDEEFEKYVDSGMLKATLDFSLIANMDFIIICVPTPLDDHKQPDMSFIEKSVGEVSKYITKQTVVVLESTTYPRTTEDFIKPILENGSGLKCGIDFYLGFSPERIDPGNEEFKTKNTPKIVGAIGEEALEVIVRMYESILDTKIYKVSSPAVAEMEKILENTYRNINIALVNELAILCNRMNINIWEVIEAAKTKPYGFKAFYPGPGIGGHCIPLDPYYLSWKAKEYDFHTSLIDACAIINDKMPEYCVQRISKLLDRYKKSINESKILILGVSYKEDINDCRESPAIKVFYLLKQQGADIRYYDKFVEEFQFKNISERSIREINKEVLESYDLVVITTKHSNINYDDVQKYSKLIFDTKNATKNIRNKVNIEVL